MRTNPYRAPESDITPLPQTMPARPPAVTLTCAMFALNLLASFVDFMPQNEPFWKDISSNQRYAYVAVLIIGVMVTAWLIYAVSQGRNWARWVKLGLGVLGVLMLLLPADPEAVPTSQLINLINITGTFIELPACALLFLGKGRKWFVACKNLASQPF
jgi:predicted membrane channel-forming protein YqfA (hemolysin III family)